MPADAVLLGSVVELISGKQSGKPYQARGTCSHHQTSLSSVGTDCTVCCRAQTMVATIRAAHAM